MKFSTFSHPVRHKVGLARKEITHHSMLIESECEGDRLQLEKLDKIFQELRIVARLDKHHREGTSSICIEVMPEERRKLGGRYIERERTKAYAVP